MASSSSQAQKRVRLEDTQPHGVTAAGKDQPDAPPPPPPPLHPHQLLNFAPATAAAASTLEAAAASTLEAALGCSEGAVRRAHLGVFLHVTAAPRRLDDSDRR
ncbi:hypothetical protein L1987_20481 [Smallanthus sonchifolius]|uniref:Uncharacterized protein n=1 Tax=Smallanthus sonchifolius TaxID=185202 RepID=A0ACB9ITN1_9ASTR|nr:hypothetical protein L1987_20481 [Smallanthus sonchifolius]